MFGTAPPKPTLLSSQELPKLLSSADEISAPSIMQHLTATVGSKNRITHQEKMMQVEKYIYDTLKKLGWKTQRQQYFHETHEGWDSAGGGTRRAYKDLNGVNIIAIKKGANPNRIVIIGAHYDTVDNTPGADDNGTGIAALLELARVLGKHDYDKTLMLVAFDMEEIGLLGSKAFVEKLPKNAVVEGAIIFDTMGYVDDKENSQKIPAGFSLLYRQQVDSVKGSGFKGNFITVIHNGESRKLASLIGGANQSLRDGMPLIFIRDPLDLPVLGPILKVLFPALRNLLRSDHAPFWRAKMPAIQLADSANFRNPNYHRPTDTIETVNIGAVEKVTQMVAVAASVLAEIKE